MKERASMYEPTVSIITVCLNSEKTIERTIKSVINQSYVNIEYIVIDGGSIDNTKDIIKKYEAYISYFISEKDQGIYDAINKGIDAATGDIIGIINSDDWYMEDAVETIVDCSREKEAEVYFGDFFFHEDGKNNVHNVNPPFKQLWHNMVMGHPAVFVIRKVYECFGKFDLSYRIAADFNFLNQLYYAGVSFVHIAKPIVFFSMGGISTTRVKLCEEETIKIRLHNIRKKIFIDILKEYLVDNRNIYIFGIGSWGIYIVEIIKDIVNIAGLIDNKQEKWNDSYLGYTISPPGSIKYTNACVFITAVNCEKEIEIQLLQMGIESKNIIKLSECLGRYEELIALECMNYYEWDITKCSRI